MKKFLIGLGVVLGILLLGGLVLFLIFHEPRPDFEPSPEADARAEHMLDALHHEAWDSTRYLAWTFIGRNHYFWDKEENMVELRWNENRVILHTKSLKALVFKDGERLEGWRANRLRKKAWRMFINDGFWFCAPYKVFDPGTERALVTLKDGREGLMVRYASGGVTPGDAYVWILGPDDIPEAYKMWVKIIPIGGVEATWEGWAPIDTGALLAVRRVIGGKVELEFTNIRGSNDLNDFDFQENPLSEWYE
jgi:hypothetical protein